MELLLIALAIALARWAASRFGGEEDAPPPVPAAPLPPRTRPRRVPRAPALPASAEEPDSSPAPVVARPAAPAPARSLPRSAHAADFRGAAALRRAVVAREVLGPPLSLRGR